MAFFIKDEKVHTMYAEPKYRFFKNSISRFKENRY